jgi:hypothetical protein
MSFTKLPHQKRSRISATWAGAFVALCLAACSSGDPAKPNTSGTGGAGGSNSGGTGGTGGSGGGSGADAGATDPSAVIGAFAIRLNPPIDQEPAYTSVEGSVLNAPRPSVVQWKLVAEEGGCKLSTPFTPFCERGCPGGTCVADDKCQESPSPRSVGTATVKGLKGESGPVDVVLPGESPNYVYVLGATPKLAFPPFQEGADVELSTTGGDFPAFTTKTKGISLLEVTSPNPIRAAQNEPMQLRWKPPASAQPSRIIVDLNISHHGGTKGVIECDVPDNGSLDVPASLMTKLIQLGVAGYPTVDIIRRTASSFATPSGKIEFIVASRIVREVLVPGFTSCSEKEPCPGGKVCQQDMLCPK